MESKRAKFKNADCSKAFFKQLREKSGCETLLNLAKKLGVPYECLKLWVRGKRSVPFSLIEKWSDEFAVPLKAECYSTFDLRLFLRRASEKGVSTLKKRLGSEWSKKLGRRGMKTLQKRLTHEKALREKWKRSTKASLKKKFGANCYRVLGTLGGRKSIQNCPPEKMARQREKAFRRSFKSRIVFRGVKYRSFKELEVAKLLSQLGLRFEYERKLLGFYPDFFLQSKRLVIEVFGFDWAPHVKRTKEKLIAFSKAGYRVLVYTYPNLKHYFVDSPTIVFTNLEDVNFFLTAFKLDIG